VLAAPLGKPTIGFMYMVGEAELAAWDAAEAAAAVATFSSIVHLALSTTHGYLVRASWHRRPCLAIEHVSQ
jgi:hypothetical protein